MSLFNCAATIERVCNSRDTPSLKSDCNHATHALWCLRPFVSSRCNREQVISCRHRRTSFAFRKTYVRMCSFECVTNGKFHEIYRTNSRVRELDVLYSTYIALSRHCHQQLLPNIECFVKCMQKIN